MRWARSIRGQAIIGPVIEDYGGGVVAVDSRMNGWERITAVYYLPGPRPAIIETAPATSLEHVLSGLEEAGAADLDWIVLTHIHLDHAGAAGHLAQRFPRARVVVRAEGAPHLVDPSKLWQSASRLYDDMEGLWGRMIPVSPDRIDAVSTDGVVADWKPDMLTVWASTQGTASVRDEMAGHFELQKSKVRVITEFMGGGTRIIQTNYRDGGWIFDGAAKTLKDQNARQIEDFRVAMRTSIENPLRGWWRKQGATLSYVGRREAGVGRRNETVRLTYQDGFWIEYEFAAADNLPAKILYQRKHKKTDSDEMEDIPEEDRLHKPITIDGVIVPYVIDHLRNGVQTSRINYESVELNKTLPDSLFTKPANIKAIK